MLHSGIIFVIGLAGLIVVVWRFRWPLPIGLMAVSVLAGLLAGFLIPFRHLVEGSFGYINLVLGLFAGAFFGHVMLTSGAAGAVAARVGDGVRDNAWLMLLFAGAILFLVGMYVGIAGVAVLATGAFVVPLLRRLGMPGHEIAAFMAAISTCGMIAPPVNVPVMSIADGVNMPYTGLSLALTLLSLPPAILTLVFFAMRAKRYVRPEPSAASQPGAAVTGFLSLAIILGFWTLLRLFPMAVPDPAAPLVLVVGALPPLFILGRAGVGRALAATFSGTPLELAAVLATVGVLVQIMALTGVRGWLVITVMSVPEPWSFIGMAAMPVFGSVLTSIGTANILGVPFAFSLIGQDMILNVSALSAIAALSEFVPPTAIAAALSTYVVGDTSLSRVLRASLWPALAIAVPAILMLIFADSLSGILSGPASAMQH